MMADKPRFIRRKRFKRKSERKLSQADLFVLDFLWTWKVASTPILKEIAFRSKSQWWTYKALRQLQQERYIQALPRGRHIAFELWTLTELGFEVVLMDRDDISQYRYRPHAPAHDYLATCLQLGDLWHATHLDVRTFSEQALASLTPANFPRSFRKRDEHIPDGLTLIVNGGREALIGYEVDLNLKADERYDNTYSYYVHGPRPQLIVWLVKSQWVATKIIEALQKRHRGEELNQFLASIAFVGLDDFKARIWEAQCICGTLRGHTISKLHANLIQSLGKSAPKSRQKELRELFFPRFKSPQKLTSYTESEVAAATKHPTGVGNIN